MQDIGAGFPKGSRKCPVIVGNADTHLDGDGDPVFLQCTDCGNQLIRVFKVIFPAPGIHHGRLPAVGVYLVHNRIAKGFCKGRKGFRGTPAEVNPENNIAFLHQGDLVFEFLHRFLVQELFTVPARSNGFCCGHGRAVNGIPSDEGKTDMCGTIEHVRGINNPGHGCNAYRCPDDPVIDQEAEALKRMHHEFIYMDCSVSNYFAFKRFKQVAIL